MEDGKNHKTLKIYVLSLSIAIAMQHAIAHLEGIESLTSVNFS